MKRRDHAFRVRHQGRQALLLSALSIIPTVGEVLCSLETVIATDPRDWSIDERDAFIYAAVVGWEDALEDVAKRHGWDDATVARLRRYEHHVAIARKQGNVPAGHRRAVQEMQQDLERLIHARRRLRRLAPG